MAITRLQGNQIHTSGNLPEPGQVAPAFKLTANNLADQSLVDYAGKKVVLNIFPSIDTGVCAMSVRKFNAEAAALDNTVILCISRDLPFAMGRFCGAEGFDKAITLSELRDRNFGKDYGLELVDGPMAGLLARAVIVLDETHKVIHAELVDDIVHEPNYAAALQALNNK